MAKEPLTVFVGRKKPCVKAVHVGHEAVRFIWAKVEHAPEDPPSPLSPTKTVCRLVGATRTGPEFVKPATPPTDTVVQVPITGSRRYTSCVPKSATTSCDPLGVKARARKSEKIDGG